MDNPLLRPSAQSLQKPQVFVKVEFGVSWTGQHPPHKRRFEYKSRALRERNPDFPRHVPAPTFNYLATDDMQHFQENYQIPQFEFQSAPQDQQPSSDNANQPRDYPGPSRPSDYAHADNVLPEHYEPERGRPRHIEAIPEPPWLGPIPVEQSRLSSGERHERGSSAPPPLSDNNWDVVHQRASTQCIAGPSNERPEAQDPASSSLWKELPEVPTRYRLGEEGLPWEGTWTFPMGFEPYFEPDPYLQSESSHSSPKPPLSRRRSRSAIQRHASPTFPHSQPAFIQSPQSPPRGDDPARRRELEALGSAMMTVDNGFETQWWNQEDRGEKIHLAALHPPPATEQQLEEQMALGWVGALLPTTAPGDTLCGRRMSLVGGRGDPVMSPESSYNGGPAYSNMVVSPVSSFSGPVTNLSRSMSTRSDELWFSGRYA